MSDLKRRQSPDDLRGKDKKQKQTCSYDAAIKAVLANNLDAVKHLCKSEGFSSHFTGQLLQRAAFVDDADALVGWLLTVTHAADVPIHGYILAGNLRMLRMCVMNNTNLTEYVGFGLRSGSLEVVSFLLDAYPEIPALHQVDNASRNEVDVRVFPYVVRSMQVDLRESGWVMPDCVRSLHQLEWILKNQLIHPHFAKYANMLIFFADFLCGAFPWENGYRNHHLEFIETALQFKTHCDSEQKQAHESLTTLLPNPDLVVIVVEYMSVMDAFMHFEEELKRTIGVFAVR